MSAEKKAKEFCEGAETWWETLSKEDQLRAFCCVSKRIHEGEIKTPSSLRGVLFDVFGFGENTYDIAIECGYFDLHNSIYTTEEKEELEHQD